MPTFITDYIVASISYQEGGGEVAGTVLEAWFSGNFIQTLLALALVLGAAIWYLDRRNTKLVENIIANQTAREKAMLERHEEREDAATTLQTERDKQHREDRLADVKTQKELLQWILDRQAETQKETTSAFKGIVDELKSGLEKDTGQLRNSIETIVSSHEKWMERVTNTLGGFGEQDAKIIGVLDNMQRILKENQEARQLRAEFEAYKATMGKK